MGERSAVALLAVGQTLAWAAGYYVFPALILSWEADQGWSRSEITLGITLGVLVSGLMAPVAGRVIDRGGGPVLMAGAALMAAVLLAVLSQVTELWAFLAVWAAMGLAFAGLLYEPCFAHVTHVLGARAKAAIIPITLAAGFAGTISFPAVHALTGSLGWRGTLMIAAAVEALLVAPMLWAGARGLGQARPVEPEPWRRGERSFLRRPAFFLLAGAFGCVALVQGTTIHHLLPYLAERGVADNLAVLAAASIGPMQVAGRILMLATQARVSHSQVTLATLGALALAMALLLAVAVLPVALAGFVVLFGGAYGTVSILRPVLAREILGGRDFGAKSGALALPYLAGSALAPFFAALLWQAGGYGLVFGLAIALALVGASLFAMAQAQARAGS